jgi:hypothetical protein
VIGLEHYSAEITLLSYSWAQNKISVDSSHCSLPKFTNVTNFDFKMLQILFLMNLFTSYFYGDPLTRIVSILD